MEILETFNHDGKKYQIRHWRDDSQNELIARAFCEGRAIEGFSYSCSDETYNDIGINTYKEIIIRCIKGDVIEDRWGEVVRAYSVR